jgi:hypothetical protein
VNDEITTKYDLKWLHEAFQGGHGESISNGDGGGRATYWTGQQL